jgi:hypothetical protein
MIPVHIKSKDGLEFIDCDGKITGLKTFPLFVPLGNNFPKEGDEQRFILKDGTDILGRIQFIKKNTLQWHHNKSGALIGVKFDILLDYEIISCSKEYKKNIFKAYNAES